MELAHNDARHSHVSFSGLIRGVIGLGTLSRVSLRKAADMPHAADGTPMPQMEHGLAPRPGRKGF